MKKLVINGLYIYSLKEKKAYHTEFKDGINFVTSCKENGNKRGKSVIMKSIYSTLGADCSFDPKWDFANKTTILDININDDKYYFIRSNNYFRIVDSNFKIIFETTRRIELSEKLSELFDFYIELPNRENKLELTPPAYMYLLNYVDQTGLNCTTFSSFKGLAQYSNYKKYALLSHFGVFNEEYYDLDKKLKDSNDEMEANRKEANDLDKLIQKIEKELSGNNYSLDMTSLNHEIELSRNEYNEIVKNLNDTRNKIIQLQNSKTEVEHLLEELKNNISDNNKNYKNYDNETCPYCKSHIDPFEFSYKYYDKNDDYLFINQSLMTKLDDLKHNIKLQEEHYKMFIDQMNVYDKKIKTINSGIDDVIKHKGFIEMQNKLSEDLYKLKQREITLTQQIKDIRSKIRKYNQLKQEIDNEYFNIMSESRDTLSLQEINPSNIKKIDSSFDITGSMRPLSTIAWYLCLLKIKDKFNPNAIKLPIVFDSPNNAELDDDNIAKTFKYILDNIDNNSQVIISTIEFKKELYQNYKINNVIELTNEPYKLLNDEDYAKTINLYKKIMNL